MGRLSLALLLIVASSCGTIAGQIPFSAPGHEGVVVSLEAGREVRFWADFAAHYEGAIGLEEGVAYEVELFQGSALVANVRCNPRDYGLVSLCKTRVQGFHSYDGDCRMACVALVPKSGPSEVRATLSAGPSVQIERATLIVRQ